MATLGKLSQYYIEMFYLNSTLNIGIPLVLVFQLEVYFKVDRPLTGLTDQLKEQLLDAKKNILKSNSLIH